MALIENKESLLDWLEFYKQKQYKHTLYSIDYFQCNKNTDRSECLEIISHVHHNFIQCPNILFLAVNYFDRLSCLMTIAPNKQKLFAVVTLAIACKYEQTEVRIASSSYLKYLPFQTLREFNQAERLVLKVLEWNLTVTTIMNMTQWFVQYHSIVIPMPPISVHMMLLISEWSISCPVHYQFRPLIISMACYWIILAINDRSLCTKEWMVHLICVTETSEQEFLSTLSFIASIIIKEQKTWLSNKSNCLFSTRKFDSEYMNKTTQIVWTNNAIIKQFII